MDGWWWEPCSPREQAIPSLANRSTPSKSFPGPCRNERPALPDSPDPCPQATRVAGSPPVGSDHMAPLLMVRSRTDDPNGGHPAPFDTNRKAFPRLKFVKPVQSLVQITACSRPGPPWRSPANRRVRPPSLRGRPRSRFDFPPISAIRLPPNRNHSWEKPSTKKSGTPTPSARWPTAARNSSSAPTSSTRSPRPQAFGMLRDLGLPVKFPQRTFATVDHIVPDRSTRTPRPTRWPRK